MLVFSFIYYVTPDVQHRSFRWVTRARPWRVALARGVVRALRLPLERRGRRRDYGTFAGPIVLVGWLWLRNVALLFGAEFNAEIERQRARRRRSPPRDAEPARPDALSPDRPRHASNRPKWTMTGHPSVPICMTSETATTKRGRWPYRRISRVRRRGVPALWPLDLPMDTELERLRRVALGENSVR